MISVCRTDASVQVRPFAAGDVGAFLEAVLESLPSLCRWMPWCHAGYGREDAQRWIEHCERSWAAGNEYPLGIFDAASGDVLGGTGINHISRSYNFGNLGYWVREGCRGRGIATTAARLAAEMAFEELGLSRVEIFALTDNAASQGVARKLGATREGVARNRLLFRGEPRDAIAYSLVPGDLRR